ncbi:MAG: HAMP domain-containing histidine kinase [Hyphomicrobiaceae bacterium]|nr:HAMP domain-containing histidine kinase [Hyphomicrobiaceae bacterium]
MGRGSIAARLFALSAAWLVIALVATAFLLTELYSRALDAAMIDNLNFNLETLVGRTLNEQDVASASLQAADPRFERTGSGYYWEIRTEGGIVVNTSKSLLGSILPAVDSTFDESGRRSAVARDDFDTNIRIVERRIGLPSGTYLFAVTGNLDENTALTDNFRWQAILVLVAVGAALAVMSALVARVALRPVEKLRSEMEDVRDGTNSEIAGQYPRELAPLAQEVNELLRSNAQIVERARAQVGNLAHGLKTPLAVLRNEAESRSEPLALAVREQTNRMTDIVSTYLDRARLAARTAVVGKRADAQQTLTRLVRVMQKIHPDRQLMLNEVAPLWFRGDEADFEEIAGNLLDNACKFAKNTVEVSLRAHPEGRRQIRLLIDDDGPGLTEAERHQVLRRGVRLDEKVQGSGLGLDIVKELIDIYGGTLQLGPSDLGGLSVTLDLPAAKSPS